MRSNREAIGTAVLGAAAAGSVALLTMYLSKRKIQAVRRATVSCHCGKFKAEICQPAANYKYAETANMQCGCHDCVGFCKSVGFLVYYILVISILPKKNTSSLPELFHSLSILGSGSWEI